MFLPQHGITTKCICFYMQGSREGQWVQTQNLGCLNDTGLDPHKNRKASVQCLAIINPSVKHRLFGVSLVLYGVLLAGR